MRLKNFMEDVVMLAYKDYIKKDPAFCCCERCQRDVIVIALNSLQAKYVGSEEGEIRAAVAQSDRQIKTDATLALMEAAKLVKERPHHREGA